MQIEIKDPVLGALVAALIANANTIEYQLTVEKKIAKHFPGGTKAFRKLNNNELGAARQRLYDRISEQLKKENINLYKGTAPWCVPKKIAGHDIAYRSDGVMFSDGGFVSLENMEQMVKECKNV